MLRQSPDWAALARDFRAGAAIDPARYAPLRPIPSFPADIVDLVARWNALSAVDFFACRQALKEVAQATLRRIARAMVVPCTELPRAMAALEGARFLLFFCDDDDWFAPGLTAILSALELADADVAVFPFVRFGWQTCSFVHPTAPPRVYVGLQHAFPQRYHTNNYGLASHMRQPSHLAAMQDHFDASAHGDRMRLVDRHFPLIVSATNKTPCAASFLRTTVADADGFASLIAEQIRELNRYPIPDELGWMREPLAMTTRLFESVLSRRRFAVP